MIKPESASNLNKDAFKPELLVRIHTSNQATGYFISSISGKKYMVTYLTTDVNGWKIVTIQPFKDILNFVTKLRTVSLFTIVIFLILTMILAVFISHRLYKPIERLLKQVKEKPDEALSSISESDELAYISSAFMHIFD